MWLYAHSSASLLKGTARSRTPNASASHTVGPKDPRAGYCSCRSTSHRNREDFLVAAKVRVRHGLYRVQPISRMTIPRFRPHALLTNISLIYVVG